MSGGSIPELLFFLGYNIFNDIHTACGFVIHILVTNRILIDHVNIAFWTNAILPGP